MSLFTTVNPSFVVEDLACNGVEEVDDVDEAAYDEEGLADDDNNENGASVADFKDSVMYSYMTCLQRQL